MLCFSKTYFVLAMNSLSYILFEVIKCSPLVMTQLALLDLTYRVLLAGHQLEDVLFAVRGSLALPEFESAGNRGFVIIKTQLHGSAFIAFCIFSSPGTSACCLRRTPRHSGRAVCWC